MKVIVNDEDVECDEQITVAGLLERLGFQLEGLRREYSLEEDGELHGSAIFGLLRREYEDGRR